jgi:hypothetical protein
MIGVILTHGQQKTLAAILQWMAGDSEFCEIAKRITIQPVGTTQATREDWAAIGIAAEIWGAANPPPFDAMGIANLVERRLREVPVIREPELEPEPELKQGSLF